MELMDFKRILRSEQIRLSILFHSLSAEERRKALATVKELRPTMKNLLLVTPHLSDIDEEVDEVLSTSHGPGALVATVNRILRRQGE